MHKELKFKIISECMNNGVSITCKKYSISRTIYYRWLKRYKSFGIDGLNDIKKDFVPVNKTNPEIEKTIMDLIKVYPSYGPKTLNYLLEELGYNISGSAVFNVLKRHDLTNKYKRLKFSNRRDNEKIQIVPPLSELKSGECWMFWITDIGQFEKSQNIYAYTLFDIKSRIACTRLYSDISFDNFEDILTSVALSVATTLNLKINYLCFFSDSKLLSRYQNSFKPKIHDILKTQGRDIKVNILNSNENVNKKYEFKELYTNSIFSALLPLLGERKSFRDIKAEFQDFIRNYNLNNKLKFEDDFYSPIEYHNKMTNNRLILPLWAYIDRDY